MKRTMKKMLSFGLVAAMSLTMLAGCGNSKDATNDTNVSNGQEEKKPTGDVKIGVLVQDVSGEEANKQDSVLTMRIILRISMV